MVKSLRTKHPQTRILLSIFFLSRFHQSASFEPANWSERTRCPNLAARPSSTGSRKSAQTLKAPDSNAGHFMFWWLPLWDGKRVYGAYPIHNHRYPEPRFIFSKVPLQVLCSQPFLTQCLSSSLCSPPSWSQSSLSTPELCREFNSIQSASTSLISSITALS